MFFKSHTILKISGLLIFIFPIVFSILLFSKSDPADAKINCDIQHNSCTQTLSGSNIILNVSPKPVKAMANLTFQIKVGELLIKQTPYIDLDMPGMDMGWNRVELKAVSPGVFEGMGVIVRCPSGITAWRASVAFPKTGSVDFIFDVIY